MAGSGIVYPSWAYYQGNATGTPPPQIVASAAALAALGVNWSLTPYPVTPTPIAPGDQNLTVTDIRLQQLLVEARVQTGMLQAGFGLSDDPQTQLRPDVLANDSSLTS